MQVKEVLGDMIIRTEMGMLGHFFSRDLFRWIIDREYTIDCMEAARIYAKEPQTYDYLMRQNGRLAIFVGANAGGFAVRCARNFVKVVAVEPNPVVREILRRNADANGVSMSIDSHAVSDSDGVAELYEPYVEAGRAGTSSTLFRERMNNRYNSTSIRVETTTLDSIVNNVPLTVESKNGERWIQGTHDKLMPDLLVIDAEGAEEEILRGGSDAIMRTQKIIVEVRGETEGAITSTLERAGFKTFPLEHDIVHGVANILAVRD